MTGYLLFIFIFIFELFFTSNTLLAYYPYGTQGLTYSVLKKESYNWGYSQLDDYLKQLFLGKRPYLTLQTKYQFLNEITDRALSREKEDNLTPQSALLVYDANVYDLAGLWLFMRPMIYQGWPIVTTDTYLEQGKEKFLQQGIKDFYFVNIIDPAMLQRPLSEQTPAAKNLAAQLKDLSPEIIKRPDGRPVFEVYYWQ
jgi:hypothetical protein